MKLYEHKKHKRFLYSYLTPFTNACYLLVDMHALWMQTQHLGFSILYINHILTNLCNRNIFSWQLSNTKTCYMYYITDDLAWISLVLLLFHFLSNPFGSFRLFSVFFVIFIFQQDWTLVAFFIILLEEIFFIIILHGDTLSDSLAKDLLLILTTILIFCFVLG